MPKVTLQVGHRVSETQDRYAHVIRKWKGQTHVDPAERIASARSMVANLNATPEAIRKPEP